MCISSDASGPASISTHDQTTADRSIVCTPAFDFAASIATKRALNKLGDWLEDARPRFP